MFLTSGNRPLNLGRSSRLFSDAQRRALLALWGGCATCGARPERCEIHHVTPWETGGGRTDVANGVPKCRRCHHEHHRQKRRDRLEPDGTYVLRLPDGTERRHRPAVETRELPGLPVATTSEPVRPATPNATPAGPTATVRASSTAHPTRKPNANATGLSSSNASVATSSTSAPDLCSGVVEHRPGLARGQVTACRSLMSPMSANSPSTATPSHSARIVSVNQAFAFSTK